MQLTTYLLFTDNCKEAMAFYHAVFGGDLAMTAVGDSPMKDAFPATMHAKIVSASASGASRSAVKWRIMLLSPVRSRSGGRDCELLSGMDQVWVLDRVAICFVDLMPLRAVAIEVLGNLAERVTALHGVALRTR